MFKLWGRPLPVPPPALPHNCRWGVTGSTYTPPTSCTKQEAKGLEALKLMHENMDKCRRGETHIYMRCSECGDIKSKTVPGKWEKPDVFMEAVQGAINGR